VLPDAADGALLLTTDILDPAGSPGRWSARNLVGCRWASGECIDVRAAARIEVSPEEGSLVVEGTGGHDLLVTASLERVIPVRRPGPCDTVVETRFALVREGARSLGWLEFSVVLPASADLTED
jgi:hypothetical protein